MPRKAQINYQSIVPGGLYNTAAQMAPTIRSAYGCDAVLFFPFTVSQGGTAPNADGYGKNFDHSLTPSRFGAMDAELQRAAAILHACGLNMGSDEVTHQYDGGNWSKPETVPPYQEYGADGKYGSGRFPKPAWCFTGAAPRSPVDDVFDSSGNFGFGDMTSLIKSGHDGYMLNGLCGAIAWKTRYVDSDFYRHDDAKGTAVAASNKIIQMLNAMGKYGFAEVFVGYIPELQSWLAQTGFQCGLLDFPMHWNLVAACNGYNANALGLPGLCTTNPLQAWKFRDTADTDISSGEAVISNGLIANLRILTAPGGNVLMYAKDYLPVEQGGYGLAKWLANYVWIAKNLCFGDEVQRWSDNNVASFERLGYPGLLTIYNLDTWSSHTNTYQTNFGPGVELQDYTGNMPGTVWTDGQGRVTVTIRSNAYSAADNSICLSRVGYSEPFPVGLARTTTQRFEGAADLKGNPTMGPATPAGSFVANLWCDKDSKVSLNKISGDGVRFTLTDASGDVVITKGSWAGKTELRGWHRLTGFAPDSSSVPYTLDVTYSGTKDLTDLEMMEAAS